MVDNHLLRLSDTLIEKRKAQIHASGFKSMTNSNHMCAILKDGVPISYGTNQFQCLVSLLLPPEYSQGRIPY